MMMSVYASPEAGRYPLHRYLSHSGQGPRKQVSDCGISANGWLNRPGFRGGLNS